MTSTDSGLRPQGAPAGAAVVFVHGFLDDRHAWGGVVDRLASDVKTVQVDLDGCGDRVDMSGPFQLSVALTDEDMDRLVAAGARLRPEVVRDLADTWNAGHPAGRQHSSYAGPVLVLRGSGDPFVTDEFVSQAIVPRFATVSAETIEAAGHWAHVEQPGRVAAHVDRFLQTSSPTKTTSGRRTYLEWEVVAFGDVQLSGITVLTKNDAGQIERAAIHHRPLGGGLRFSAELRRRLTGVIDAAHFYPSDV